MTVYGFYLLTLLAVLGYRTCSASTTSQPTPGLKPVLQDALSTESRRINVTWTNDDVIGNYSSLYMVAWTPVPSGTSGSENTTLKNYSIQSLSPGTTYTVTVTYIITGYNREQLMPSDTRTYTTKQEYGGTCSTSIPCDDASNTISCNFGVTKCLCVDGRYRNGQACIEYKKVTTLA
ncbi:uncharacterized protein LOC125373054 [Haliotis rufescens]|uniref:uncharacterized protein LOC125373054 n=1 Tax=Haliotis rufescens TaxID=6454 RepID=UPI00201EFE7D|nr:uncharacterized protein LOC125373054 [Haliotis rufescens]